MAQRDGTFDKLPLVGFGVIRSRNVLEDLHPDVGEPEYKLGSERSPGGAFCTRARLSFSAVRN